MFVVSKKNIIIILCSVLFVVVSVCFFLTHPRNVITEQSKDISEDIRTDSISRNIVAVKNIELQNPEEPKREIASSEEQDNITASEYVNFERTIDTLMEYTWED